MATTAILTGTTTSAPRLSITHSNLPSTYLDPTQPPTHRSPWRLVHACHFVRSLRIAMPTRCWHELYPDPPQDELAQKLPKIKYAKVIMKLSDILADDDLRRGEHALLSSTQGGSDDTALSLHAGKLVINIPRPIYERSSLTFPHTTIASGARKHVKSSQRIKIEVNLREPSMVKGKRGFDRLIWAAKNVDGLREGRTWLFAEIPQAMKHGGVKRKREPKSANTSEEPRTSADGQSDTNMSGISGDKSSAERPPTPEQDTENQRVLKTATPARPAIPPALDPPTTKSAQPHPLSSHHPTIISHTPATTTSSVLIPRAISHPAPLTTLPSHDKQVQPRGTLPTVTEDDMYDLAEYLDLLFLQSPLITKHEQDSFNKGGTTYSLPDLSATSGSDTPVPTGHDQPHNSDEEEEEEVTTATWSGLLTSEFVVQVLIDLISRSRRANQNEPTRTSSLWAALQVVAHRTEGLGWTDGYTVLLQGESREAVGTRSSGVDTRRTDEEKGGFKYTTTFEYIDSGP